jgi:hypothetical protein
MPLSPPASIGFDLIPGVPGDISNPVCPIQEETDLVLIGLQVFIPKMPWLHFVND